MILNKDKLFDGNNLKTLYTYIKEHFTKIGKGIDSIIRDDTVFTVTRDNEETFTFDQKWQQNTDTQEGYVPSSEGAPNKAWKTDENGIPGWRDDVSESQEARIESIESKIPNQASAQNQLADKAYVNDSISTSTAFFRGSFASYAALMAVQWQTTDPELPNYVSNNDYAYIEDDETHQDEAWRYIYVNEEGGQDNGWQAQFKINESPLTQAQIDALNSGATTTLINQITTNKNDILLKAPIASPQFTGTPLTPNVTSESPDGQIANKKYVDEHVPDMTDYMRKGVDYVTAGKKANTTLGTKATAEGENTTASGKNSHAEGYNTIASANQAHAEGTSSQATELGAHAEGTSLATGTYSHAENISDASGDYSHAENRGQASGEYSHAEGLYTKAAGANQHVSGKYNIVDNNSVYAEIIGNGTADNARSNARTLDWNGNEVLAGKLTVGTAPVNDMDVATKKYVDENGGGGGTIDENVTPTSENAVMSKGIYSGIASRQASIWTTEVILTTNWQGNDPYSQVITISGTTESSMVDIQPDDTLIDQMVADGANSIWIENDNGILTAKITNAPLTANTTVTVKITEMATVPPAQYNNQFELKSNKSTTVTSSSTDVTYPTSKAVWDLFNSITDFNEVEF